MLGVVEFHVMFIIMILNYSFKREQFICKNIILFNK